MGCHLLKICLVRTHSHLINVASVPVLRNIALGALQTFKKLWLKITVEQLLPQLERSARILKNLSGFNTGNLIKEPATARIHEHQVSLEFQKLEGRNPLWLIQFVNGMLSHEPLNTLR